ncbi:MAG: D-amino acid aminotransferase [Burkholderiaceae bacterium]
MEAQIVHLNGEYLPLASASVSVLDRGFIFGDGVYEVVPVYGGRAFGWARHLARLRRSLARIRIEDPHDDATWNAIVSSLVSRHPWPDQLVYIQVTRGVARRDHAFPAGIVPTVFAMASELIVPSPETRARGIDTITLPDERWLNCDIKSISLLGNVLAKQAAVDAGAAECLLFRDGWLTEGSSSNVWIVRDSVVLGPPPGREILEGVRMGIIESLCAAEGIAFEQRPIARDEVLQADEVLISSATREILAVARIDGRPVGNGRPGPVGEHLYRAYQRAKAEG